MYMNQIWGHKLPNTAMNAETELTQWGQVTHICVNELTIIGSDNGLSAGQRQAIIWTKAGILLIRPLGTNFNEILIKIHIFSFKKIHLKMTSGKWSPFCLGLNVLTDMHRWMENSSLKPDHSTWQRHVDGLVQDCSVSSALALEILQSCTKHSM